MRINFILAAFGLAQALLGLRVIWRFVRTARGTRIEVYTGPDLLETERVSVLVPVLNEYRRLAPCLEGLLASGAEVGEILVVDGGSCDGTQELVRLYCQRDPRIQLLDASPIPSDWNGKSWGLHVGLQHVARESAWLLTLDADVRPSPDLARSLLVHARRFGLAVCSLATRQEIAGFGLGLLHPALLTTLVYRFGVPGHATRSIYAVQANGQCMLVQRKALETCGGFALARHSLCEDVTLARALAAAGHLVGFYEVGGLARVRMYEDWHEAWQNWPRSLPLRDHFAEWRWLLGWLELAFVQALPLPLAAGLTLARRCRGLLLLNGLYVLLRIGVLCGTARAYCRRPWSYWLSPLCDLPVVCKIGLSAVQRRHSWRGRVIVRGTSV